MNKGFLSATSSRKIKTHVEENQITMLVWPCLNRLQKKKHHTINHMIIFSDSISNFYQCSIWGFCRGTQNAEVINFLGILKNMSPRIKYIFVQERKAMFHLIKKLVLSFTQLILTQIIYYIIHRCLCSHFILFSFFYISL